MSTSAAEVSRILSIKSFDHLYSLIYDKDEMWCHIPEIITFVYSVEKLINGCNCDKDENTKTALEYYEVIKSCSEICKDIASMFGCSKVVFLQ